MLIKSRLEVCLHTGRSTPADMPDPPFRFFEGLVPRLDVLSYNPPRDQITWYRIAVNFHGRKLLWIAGKYMKKTFINCLLIPLKDATPLNFAEKTSTNSHKTSKFAQVFSLQSFPLYGMCFLSFLTALPLPKTKNGGGLGTRLFQKLSLPSTKNSNMHCVGCVKC